MPSIAPKRPLAITIGNFDGVHLGHQAILTKLKEKVRSAQGQTLVISFTNHPVEILREDEQIIVPKLCSLEHKQLLLQNQSIDFLVLLPFTKEFSQQTPEEFLKKIQGLYPFDYLILGHDAVLGRDRQGNIGHIQQISTKLNFKVEYLEEQSVGGVAISSSKIRSLIMSGDLALAEQLLGRRYSIYTLIRTQNDKILTLDVKGLCLPPAGKYEIKTNFSGEIASGYAYLNQTTMHIELSKHATAKNGYLEIFF